MIKTILTMRLHAFLSLLLPFFFYHLALGQEFSEYRGQCTEVSFNGDLSVVRAMGCALNITEAHQSQLLLDRCLSFDKNSTNLVTGQGYVTNNRCVFLPPPLFSPKTLF